MRELPGMPRKRHLAGVDFSWAMKEGGFIAELRAIQKGIVPPAHCPIVHT